MSRRKRRPEPAVVDARPPRWFLGATAGVVAVLVGPPVVAVVSGEATIGTVGLALWSPVVLVLIWRSRLVVDRDGVTFTFLGSRHVPWSDIEAVVASSSGFGLRGPHLRVRGGRPVPLNPLWRADGKTIPEAIEPWARRKRVKIEGGADSAARRRPQLLMIVMLVVIGSLVGAMVANLTGG